MAKSDVASPTAAPKRSMSQDERKWRAEDALRDLERAQKHQSDPDLMADVAKCRDEKMRGLAKIKVEVAPKTMKSKK